MHPHRLATTLLHWFATHGRDLPWRHTRDPYAIWLSEIILQQTRVAQGTAYWHRFMAAYPTVEALAAASEDDVLKLWQGLGYYSRARNLHAAARQIVAMGHFPSTLEAIRSLRGVGDYTAAAIASFAFGIPVAAVDGNFHRVLARVHGIDTPINSTPGRKLLNGLAQEMMESSLSPTPKSLSPNPSPVGEGNVPEGLPRSPSPIGEGLGERLLDGLGERLFSLSPSSALNAAMMDFGATQCVPKSPDCPACPLAEECEALRQGRVAQLPVKTKTTKVQTRHMTYVYIRCNGQIAIHQRGAGDIWQGLWEPYSLSPNPPSLSPNPSPIGEGNVPEGLPRFPSPTGEGLGERLRGVGEHLFSLKHILTHRVILADFYLLDTPNRPALPPDYIWIDEADIDNYAVPRLIEILLEHLDEADEAKATHRSAPRGKP